MTSLQFKLTRPTEILLEDKAAPRLWWRYIISKLIVWIRTSGIRKPKVFVPILPRVGRIVNTVREMASIDTKEVKSVIYSFFPIFCLNHPLSFVAYRHLQMNGQQRLTMKERGIM